MFAAFRGVPTLTPRRRQQIILAQAPATSPVLGAELVTNGGMEIDANWENYSNPPTNERSVAIVHGGSYSRHVVGDTQYDGVKGAGFSTTAGAWYLIDAWGYGVSGAIWMSITKGDNSGDLATLLLSNGAWQNFRRAVRQTIGGNETYPLAQSRTAGAAEFYIDDESVRGYTLSSLLSGQWDAGTRPGTYAAAVSGLTVNFQAGIVCCLDSHSTPLWMLKGYIDRATGKAYLLKIENGTTTELIAVNTAYVEGASPQVVPVGADLTSMTVQLWYNGAQVGTDQTVDLHAGYESKVDAFSTDPAASIFVTARAA